MKPVTLEGYMVEPARGVRRASGLAVTTVVVVRLRADGQEYAFTLSPVDAMQLSIDLQRQASIAREDQPT